MAIQLVKWVAIAYLVLMAYAILFADKLLFPVPPPQYAAHQATLRLTSTDGHQLAAVYRRHAKPAAYTVLFSHGNGSDLGTVGHRIQAFYAQGYDVLAYDYQGYGHSQGTPSEQHSYDDITAAYLYLTDTLQIPPNQIIIYGHSLGAAISLDLAVRQPAAALILESPFVTAFRVKIIWPLLPWDKYDNLSKLPEAKMPILLVHGKLDRVVPFWHAEKLLQAAPHAQYLWLRGARHNDALEAAGQRFWQVLAEVLQKK